MVLRFLDLLDLPGDWGRIEPLFQKVVDRACHGEFSVADLARMAHEGKICVGVAEEEGLPVMAMAFEFVDYPSGKRAVNVLAMGGSRLDEFMGRFWQPFKEWARQQGCVWIECHVSPGMERIHHRYVFETVYRELRMLL